MHLELADCPVPFSGHCDLDSDLVSRIGNTSIFLR